MRGEVMVIGTFGRSSAERLAEYLSARVEGPFCIIDMGGCGGTTDLDMHELLSPRPAPELRLPDWAKCLPQHEGQARRFGRNGHRRWPVPK